MTVSTVEVGIDMSGKERSNPFCHHANRGGRNHTCKKHKLEWSLQWVPHRCRTGLGQKPDIIDYFLVSTLIRPLILKCEVVKSVPWGPHYGEWITLNIDLDYVVSRQLIGKISKRRGQGSDQTEEACPAIRDEARRKCVFDSKKPPCQDGQEEAKTACSQYDIAVGFQEEADTLGHALETWSDTTAQ